MVAGIIVTAAADQVVIAVPGRTANATIAWYVLGGTALFLAGHAMFKAVVWRVVPVTRLVALVVLALLALLVDHVTTLTLAICAAAVVVLVAASDPRPAAQPAVRPDPPVQPPLLGFPDVLEA
jgi:low temperature requirement protein LtrA